MNYNNIYNNLIFTRKSRGLNKKVLDGYYEKHHIIPKCLGGKDILENYVLLTFREHIIAHKLLLKIYPGNKKLMKALTRMLTSTIDECGNKKRREIKSSREAEVLRKLYIESLSGDGNPNFGKIGKNASHYGHKHSDETKRKISLANKGKLVGEKNPRYGVRPLGSSNPMFGKFGGDHPASKKILDTVSGKIYNSVNECSTALGFGRKAISRWAKLGLKGLTFLSK